MSAAQLPPGDTLVVSPDGGSWAQLPAELLAGVFRSLDAGRDRKAARLVCRQWAAGHGLAVGHLHPTRANPARLAARFPALTSLDLRKRTREEHPPGLLRQLGALRGLRHLNLDSCRVATDAELAGLAPLRDLSSLVASHCWWLKGTGFAALAGLPRLASISLSACDVSAAGLAAVAALPALTALDLNFCWRLCDDDVAALAAATRLASLKLAGSGVGDAGARVVAGLPRLTALDMGGCEVTDAGVGALAALPALESLSIQQSLVTDEALPGLAAMPALAHLNLTQCCLVYGGGLAALGASPALRTLCLKGCPLQESGREALRDIQAAGTTLVVQR